MLKSIGFFSDYVSAVPTAEPQPATAATVTVPTTAAPVDSKNTAPVPVKTPAATGIAQAFTKPNSHEAQVAATFDFGNLEHRNRGHVGELSLEYQRGNIDTRS